MASKITLPLPQNWLVQQEVYTDEQSGQDITHLEAHLPNDKAQTDEAMIDLYVGPMPEDTCAQDEALANYVDMIGFDDDDEEDPITEWPFQKTKAYGFEGLCEDESPLRVMCIEIKKGILLIGTVIGKNDDELVCTVEMVEKNLRVE